MCECPGLPECVYECIGFCFAVKLYDKRQGKSLAILYQLVVLEKGMRCYPSFPYCYY